MSFNWPNTSGNASKISEMRFSFSTIKKLRRQCGFLIKSFNYDSIKKEISITFGSGYECTIQDIDLVCLPRNGSILSIMTKKDDLCLVEVKIKES